MQNTLKQFTVLTLMFFNLYNSVFAYKESSDNIDDLERQILSGYDSAACFKVKPKFSYYYIPAGRRLLTIIDGSIGLDYNNKFSIWLGKQKVEGQGINRSNRFHTNTMRFGAKISPFKINNQKLFLQYEGYRPNYGVLRTSDSMMSIHGAQIHDFKLSYSYIDILYSYSNVAEKIADIYGAGAHYKFRLSKNFIAKLKSKMFFERPKRTISYANACKYLIESDFCYKPFGNVKLNLGATLFPIGIPFGGTSLNSLSVFTLLEGEGLVSRFKKHPVGLFKFDITLKLP